MTLASAWRNVFGGVVIVLLVFLPVYLVALTVQLFLTMPPTSADLMDHLAGAVITYVGLSLTALGGAVQGLFVALFPSHRPRMRQIGALASGALVPAIAIAGQIPGSIFLSATPACTAIASVFQGMAFAYWVGRRPKTSPRQD